MSTKRDTPEKKAAHAAAQRKWRKENPERWREIVNAARRKWSRANYAFQREIKREHRYKVRQEILGLLGGAVCVHCGYDKDWRALQIDHVDGGGRHDKRTWGGNTNLWTFRNWIIKNPDLWKGTYQVLCANCNWIKRFEKGEHAAPYAVFKDGSTKDLA